MKLSPAITVMARYVANALAASEFPQRHAVSESILHVKIKVKDARIAMPDTAEWREGQLPSPRTNGQRRAGFSVFV